MIKVPRRRDRGRGEGEINLAPLIDMIFILLIFFVVTTNFIKESGIEVDRPQAQTARQLDSTGIVVTITKNNEIYMEHERIDLRSVRSLVRRAVNDSPQSSTIVVADEASNHGIVMQVYDECRLAGAKKVALATKRKS